MLKHNKGKLSVIVGLLSFLLVGCGGSANKPETAKFPDKSINLIVPYAAADLRILAPGQSRSNGDHPGTTNGSR